jgi:hypothetical protein
MKERETNKMNLERKQRKVTSGSEIRKEKKLKEGEREEMKPRNKI